MKSCVHLKLMVWVILPLVSLTLALAQTTGLSRDARWREDVRFYAQELPKRHKNLFFKLSEEEFEQEVKSLEARAPTLSDSEIALELMRITARIGDGHTQSDAAALGSTFFPLWIKHFAEGWFVIQTIDQYKQALGARLIEIEGVKIEQAAQAVRDLIAADNEFDLQGRTPLFLRWAEVLQAKGILKNIGMGTFILLDQGGKRFSLDVRAVSRQELMKIPARGLSDVAKVPIGSGLEF